MLLLRTGYVWDRTLQQVGDREIVRRLVRRVLFGSTLKAGNPVTVVLDDGVRAQSIGCAVNIRRQRAPGMRD